MTMSIKTYSELVTLKTFEERYEYLRLGGMVGLETFGSDRYLNQAFYNSDLWKSIRNEVIVRDLGCDLGIEGREIFKYIIIHHMNPITVEDLLETTELAVNPEYLICTTSRTHKAIHYGDKSLLVLPTVERSKNDTCIWRNLK